MHARFCRSHSEGSSSSTSKISANNISVTREFPRERENLGKASRGNFPARRGKVQREISENVGAARLRGGGVIKRLQAGRSCKINVCKLRPSMSAGEPLFVDILKVLWSLRFESAFLAFRACLFCAFRISADFFFSLECSLILKIFVVRREKSFFLQLVWSG